MSPAVFLYAVIFVLVAVGLWAVYRVLGTPSRLKARDYQVVLDDLVRSVEREATRLRAALERNADGESLAETARAARKIFQTGYYQALRLRPDQGQDPAGQAKERIKTACEAYDWASRMIGSESRDNPAIRESALRLLDAGDQDMREAEASLGPVSPPNGNTAP